MAGYSDILKELEKKDPIFLKLIIDARRIAIMVLYMSGKSTKTDASDAIWSLYTHLKMVDTAALNSLKAGRIDYETFKAVLRDMESLHPKYIDSARGFSSLSGCAKLVSNYTETKLLDQE